MPFSEPSPDLPSEREGRTDRPGHDRSARRGGRADRSARRNHERDERIARRERERQADRERRSRHPRPDREIIAADPSLASLAWHGWQLDGIPTTSVAWAFAGALGTSLFAFGLFGAAMVIAGVLVAVLLAGSAVMMRDVEAARVTLRIARLGLIGCVLAAAAHL